MYYNLTPFPQRKAIILGFFLFQLIALSTFAQVKVGDHPASINSNSLFELESTNRGLLIPRLALLSTTSASPLTAHVNGMIVYNTATNGTGSTAVNPGFYYDNGSQWVRVLDQLNLSGYSTNNISINGDTIKSNVNGVISKATLINSVSNSSSGNTMTTTVNGITGSSANIINSNTTTLSGTNLSETINGVASTPVNLAPAINSTAWSLLGNTGTNGNNFLGTSDNASMRFRTNNTKTMTLDSVGQLTVGPWDIDYILSSKGISPISGSIYSINNGGTYFSRLSNNRLSFYRSAGAAYIGGIAPNMSFYWFFGPAMTNRHRMD